MPSNLQLIGRTGALRRYLPLLRYLWIALVALELLAFVIAIPAYATQLTSLCPDEALAAPGCNYAQLTAARLATLNQLGISFQAYVT